MILPSGFHASGDFSHVDRSRLPRLGSKGEIRIMAPREFGIEASLILQALARAQTDVFGGEEELDSI